MAGSDGFEVGGDVCVDVADGPVQAAQQQILKSGVGPDVFTVAHGGEEDPSLAVGSGPGRRVGAAFVFRAFHAGGFLDEDDVQVWREFLEGIPFLHKIEIAAQILAAGELGIDHAHFRLLLRAVFDEFPAKHKNVGIGLVAIMLVTGTFVTGVGLGMKGVAGRVSADEAFAIFDGFQEGSFAFGGHGWLFVRARSGEVAGGVKEEGIELGEFFRGKEPAILAAGDFEAVLLSKFGEDFLGVAEFAIGAANGAVLKAGGFGEEENAPGIRGVGNRASHRNGGAEETKNRFQFHDGLLLALLNNVFGLGKEEFGRRREGEKVEMGRNQGPR